MLTEKLPKLVLLQSIYSLFKHLKMHDAFALDNKYDTKLILKE